MEEVYIEFRIVSSGKKTSMRTEVECGILLV